MKSLIVVGMVAVIGLLGFGIWRLFSSNSNPFAPAAYTIKNSQSFSTASNAPTQEGETPTTEEPIDPSLAPQGNIFKLFDGPVTDAVVIQTSNPTTTVARFVRQDTGHVLDIPIGVPGAISRVISNTTVPGLAHAQWHPKGSSVVAQYEDGGVTKTVFLGMPTSATSSVRARFLPNNITSFAISPDGKSVVYLIQNQAGGSTGYLAKTDGTSAVTLFSYPLSQLHISWPSTNTLLLQTKPASGKPGIALSVDAQKGIVTPLVYTEGLSASANPSFTKIIYQKAPREGVRTTYSHDVRSGKDLTLPFNPIPEKCAWNPVSTTTLYCAAPLTSTPTNYLDLWHMGIYSAPDSIFAFDIGQGITRLAASPSKKQGGQDVDIHTLRVSPDGKYLLYIAKGDRSLWAARLTP